MYLRSRFPGAYIKEDESGPRFYCRSPLDGIRTRMLLESDETVYDGVVDLKESNEDDDALLLQVLSEPSVQRVMGMLGGTVISVKPHRKPK